MQISGIYEIVNLSNNKRYIGQSVDIISRFRYHKHNLHQNKHSNIHLQRAFNINGGDNFKFNILGEYSPLLLCLMEQIHMSIYNFQDELYNIEPSSYSSYGVKRSAETRKKISDVQKGKIVTEEHKKNIREGLLRRQWQMSPEQLHKFLEKGKTTRIKKGEYAGELHPNAKLSNTDVQVIRDAAVNRVPLKELASQYNVTYRCIWGICSGKTRKSNKL